MRRSFFTIVDNQHYVYSISTFGLKVNDLYTPENEHAAILFR